MNKTLISIFLVIAIISTGAHAQEAASPKIKLNDKELYFTEPYNLLEPPVADLIGMSLEIDYAHVKYPHGFVNTLTDVANVITFKKRVPILVPDQLARAQEMSERKLGEAVTVVSAEGKAYRAQIVGFSYVGNSPSTVLVTADLKVVSANPDASVFNEHGLALIGEHNVPATGKISARPALSKDDPLAATLFGHCSGTEVEGAVIEDKHVVPASLDDSGAEYYFVSYWSRPEADFEIEDVKMHGCLMKRVGESFSKAEMPMALRVIQLYDLDQNGKAEIYAMTGDGFQVCYVYLAGNGKKYQMIREGMCAGY